MATKKSKLKTKKSNSKNILKTMELDLTTNEGFIKAIGLCLLLPPIFSIPFLLTTSAIKVLSQKESKKPTTKQQIDLVKELIKAKSENKINGLEIIINDKVGTQLKTLAQTVDLDVEFKETQDGSGKVKAKIIHI